MKKHFSSGMLFLIIIIAITFPLVLNMTKYFPGFFSTDESYASLWDSWRIKYSFQHGMSFKNTDLITHPFSLNLYDAGYLPFLWFGIICFLSIFTNPMFAYNIQIIFNLFLSCFFAYFLAFYLTKNRSGAFFSGIIFAFCPYQFIRIWQHLGLTYNQWLVFCIFAIILLKENSQKKYFFLFLLSLLLLFSFDFSVMYLTTIGIAAFVIYIFFYNWKIKVFKQRGLLEEDLQYAGKIIIAGLLAIIVLSAQFFPIFRNMIGRFYLSLAGGSVSSAWNFYQRPFGDLFAQSARPLSYFLPATVHPFFGKFTEQFIGSPLYGESLTEHALYLGWTPLVLAFVAFRRWRKNRREIKNSLGEIPPAESKLREDFYIGFFILLAIAAWLFSQPPWWKVGPVKIYMPSFFMYKILPMFRAYCRFGIVLMLAVAVLAGFGFKFILEKRKTKKAKVAITALCCSLVLFEFWNWPPYKVIDVSRVPQVYYWLKEQAGDFVIAEYPLDADSPNEMYKFYQTAHEKKIINGTIPGTYANKFAQGIAKLSDSKTTGILKWMGVKYILAHREGYLKTELVEDREELDKIQENSGLKFIKAFPAQECPQKDIMCVQKTGPIDVYEVIAALIKPNIEEK